jgi:hypothetical protein
MYIVIGIEYSGWPGPGLSTENIRRAIVDQQIKTVQNDQPKDQPKETDRRHEQHVEKRLTCDPSVQQCHDIPLDKQEEFIEKMPNPLK